ncbi:MAG TPA: hypothetical protein VK255_04150 [Patescibacteria group bacterium]|nr:hypothetical protein [Patescibacteria group bacterium]
MLDYFPRKIRRYAGRNLKTWRGRFKGVGTKKIIFLAIFTLVAIARLFFSVSGEQKAWAKQAENIQATNDLELADLDPLEKIRTDEDIKAEKICAEVFKEDKKDKKITLIAEKKPQIKKDNHENERNRKIKEILSGYPMEKMVEAIGQKDKETAAFLVAIAKKESDWGKHAPSQAGRDCFNYWGYKGGYNPVQGYSCFDSPEQAVEVVGQRIDKLTDKGLNTPEKMVVWKCGSSCSWDNPKNVASWIGAVRTYWSKLVS